MFKPKRILVPTDFSQYSDMALKQAFDIASDCKSTVYVLHVAPENIHYDFSDDLIAMQATVKDIKELESYYLQAVRKKLNDQVTSILKDKKIKVVEDVVFGIPYEEILNEQKKRKIDLIVISSLGRSAIARFLLGSVARNVLKGAKCNVLLAKKV
ncbi:MAG: universal stress protein [Syntrophaceae bacterium]|nr:universal stress protein [Syntrophaceae bacterium]